MFHLVRNAQGPIAPPTPREEAQDALAKVRGHRLLSDEDMAQEMRVAQSSQKNLLRQATWKAVALWVAMVVVGVLVTTGMVFPMSTTRFVIGMGLFFLVMYLMTSGISAFFARKAPLRAVSSLDLALLALAKKDYENKDIEQFYHSSYRSMNPLTGDAYPWKSASQAALDWPQLAEVWADWLLGDKPVRHRDARELIDVATKLVDAKKWEEQVAFQAEGGETFQADLRAQALQELPAEVVAARREKGLVGQWSAAAHPTQARPRF